MSRVFAHPTRAMLTAFSRQSIAARCIEKCYKAAQETSMGRATLTLSFPEEMVREIDETRKREHRTRSEMMREAWRHYATARANLPVYAPTRTELAAIRKGREEIRRGNVATVEDFFADVERLAQQRTGKSRRPRARKGKKAAPARR